MNVLYCLLLFTVAAALSWPLGRYMTWVAGAPRGDRFDRLLSRWLGAKALAPQTWKAYGLSLLVSNALMFTLVFLMLVGQEWVVSAGDWLASCNVGRPRACAAPADSRCLVEFSVS